MIDSIRLIGALIEKDFFTLYIYSLIPHKYTGDRGMYSEKYIEGYLTAQ